MTDDTISRQAAIRWVKTECNPYGKPTLDFESGKKVIAHLEQMPAAQQWIPCRDLLPEDDKEVLVSTSSGGIYVAEYEPLDTEWYETVEYRRLHGVTAWMPLPEPYNQEDR